MAIAAVRVMGAGQAGLTSLPHFVDEFINRGFTQLSPWAGDHSDEQLEILRQERMKRNWTSKQLFGLNDDNARIGVKFETNNALASTLTRRINPLVGPIEAGLADSPAHMAAMCRAIISNYCEETYRLWEGFKRIQAISLLSDQRLVVVIPYCPEGPTSGTVGMYLGAAMRKCFADKNKPYEVIVIGVELCAPPTDDPNNNFRGYVARQELLQGVPLTTQPNDNEYWRPFDINLVVDGGEVLASHDLDHALTALDWTAARITAHLINGVGSEDLDPEEVIGPGTGRLREGTRYRWHAYLVQMISERSYGAAYRYLRYRVNLPWHRNPMRWGQLQPAARKDAFMRAISDIKPMLASEANDSVREKVEWLVHRAEALSQVKYDRSPLRHITRQHERTNEILDEAVRGDEVNYINVSQENPPPDMIRPIEEPFCLNVTLPESSRLRSAENARDQESQTLSQLLSPSASTVRDMITALCRSVLDRPDCKPLVCDSEAFFDEIWSASILNESENVNSAIGDDDTFRPFPQFFQYHLSADKRDGPHSYQSLTYKELPALNWQLPHILYDIPVEFQLQVMAAVNPDQGFMDLSYYEKLRKNYEALTKNLDSWRPLARYYGVKPPPELLHSALDGPQ